MSKLVNIEQVRAKNALGDKAKKAKKVDGEGDNLSGYPSLIINNGLIATIAFSLDKGKQHQRIADAIAFHLNDLGIVGAEDAAHLRDALCNCDASVLQRATHETLQFLSYLKRFQRG
jgi:CRISPR/Cas system CMR-associated protein Cmr5 small subunit